jgi:DNA-directed RNA polymerase sigma subunit (sigma70/sigma32)
LAQPRSIADQARTIRIPVHMIEAISKIVRTSRQMLNEIGREPAPEELAAKLGMPLEKVRKVAARLPVNCRASFLKIFDLLGCLSFRSALASRPAARP